MFSFFKRLIFKRPVEADRQIFSYWDGFKIQHADPLEIQSRLELDPVYRGDVHPQLAYENSKRGAEAFEVCIQAYKQAFNLQPYDPERRKGLIKAEVLQLHATYCLFCEHLKKSINPTQMPTLFGDATSTESDAMTTSGTLDTSSTSNGRSTDELTSSELVLNSES